MVIIAVLIASLSYGIDSKKLDAAGVQELIQEAPDFLLVTHEGKKISLKDFKGKVVILHIWATWCKPCKSEFPLFEKMYQRFSNKAFVFLAVAVDPGAVYKEVSQYAKSLGATFPVYLAREGNITDRYWTWGIPVTYFIDKRGWIAGRAIGPKDWDSDRIRELITALLDER